jgi:hypothetical protein
MKAEDLVSYKSLVILMKLHICSTDIPVCERLYP